MPRTAPALTALAAASAGVLLGGCIVVDTTRVYTTAAPVTDTQMTDLVARTRDLRVGMSREEALAVYPAEYLNLKSSTTDNGFVYEEWQAEAFSAKRDVYFRRYLYIANGKLAAFSDSRIDYRENTALLQGWVR